MKCVFKKYRCTPPITQKYRRGSALLAVVLILAVISSMLSVGTAKLTQAAINSTSTNKITLQAQQYAVSKADIVKATKYDELTAQNKTVISNSDGFYDEVSISAESEYPGNSNISQRECIIRVYKDSEALPRSSLKLMRYSVSTEASSVPQGSIIPWYGDKANIPDGFALCDGTKGTPDLRNRFFVGAGSNYALGDTGGEDQVTLTGTQIGNHYHYWSSMYHSNKDSETYKRSGLKLVKFGYDSGVSSVFDAPFPTGNKMTLFFTNDANLSSVNMNARFISNSDFSSQKMEYITSLAIGTDAKEPHENRPPYYALYYIMKL